MSRGVVRCLLAAALFGASTPAASVLAGDTPPLVLAGLLYLGAAFVVAPNVIRKRPTTEAMTSSWRALAAAVIFGGAIGPALLVAGLTQVDAATASILLNLERAATVALAALLFQEHLGGRVVAGAALVTAGGVLLVWQPGTAVSFAGLLIAAACVCWGIDNCVTAKIDHVRPEAVVLLKGIVAGSANLLLGLLILGGAGHLSLLGVLAALVVGALGYGVSITQWVKGARELGAARGQLIFAAAPFIGAVLAWTALGDPITSLQVLAVALAAAGVGLSIESSHEHEHRHVEQVHEHEHRHDDGHPDHPYPPGVSAQAVHSHAHRHPARTHDHPHVPELHHRHTHP